MTVIENVIMNKKKKEELTINTQHKTILQLGLLMPIKKDLVFLIRCKIIRTSPYTEEPLKKKKKRGGGNYHNA